MIKPFTKWQFYDYISESGRNPFADWFEGIPAGARAFIDDRLLKMEPQRKWSEKWASAYRGCEKIIELRIPFKNVQYRPLGVYRPDYSFVLLAGAIEKNGKIPKPDLDAAEDRRDRLFREVNCVVPRL